MKKFLESFSHAIDGIKLMLKTERNFIIQLIIGCAVLILSVILKVNLIELLFILSAIFVVLITEIINSSIENIANMKTKKYNDKIKSAKDLAAAAVLFASYYAVAVGSVIFGSKILSFVG